MSDLIEPAEEKASRLGLDLIRPDDDELFIDLDSREELLVFQKRFSQFKTIECWKKSTVSYTKSTGGGWHAYVKCRGESFDMDERLTLQAALGSDPLREMLAIFQQREGYEFLSVFFETPKIERTMLPHGGDLNP